MDSEGDRGRAAVGQQARALVGEAGGDRIVAPLGADPDGARQIDAHAQRAAGPPGPHRHEARRIRVVMGAAGAKELAAVAEKEVAVRREQAIAAPGARRAQGQRVRRLRARDLGPRRGDEASADADATPEEVGLRQIEAAPQGRRLAGAEVERVDDDRAALLDGDDQDRAGCARPLLERELHVQEVAEREDAEPGRLDPRIGPAHHVPHLQPQLAGDELRGGLVVASHHDPLEHVARPERRGRGPRRRDGRRRHRLLVGQRSLGLLGRRLGPGGYGQKEEEADESRAHLARKTISSAAHSGSGGQVQLRETRGWRAAFCTRRSRRLRTSSEGLTTAMRSRTRCSRLRSPRTS